MTEFVRDAAVTAAIFGFFAASWFGWAQDQPPQRWRVWLIAGSAGSLIVAIAGGLLAWRNWSTGTVFDRQTSIVFGVVVAVEVLLAAIGVAILTRRGRSDLVATWIALIVGLHLYPLAPLFESPLLYLTATVITVGALTSLPLARAKGTTASTYTGLITGSTLVGTALICLVVVIGR